MLDKFTAILEAIPVIGRMFAFMRGVCLLVKRDWRVLWNLRRPVMVIGSSGKDMELVASLIRDAGFFRFESPSKTAQNLDRIRGHSMVVVGYTSGETEIGRIIQAARAKSIPVIVFAASSEITDEDREAIQEYSYAEIANTPFRIMNLIFSILSTHKYNGKGD